MSLKVSKHLRYQDISVDTTELSIPIITPKAKCKDFYLEIIKQKLQRNTCLEKWMKMFNCVLSFPELYHNKMQTNFEIKISDFNFKLLNWLLATGSNLCKWNKKENAHCIYCNNIVHDECHMLYNCYDINKIWRQLGIILKININFQVIVTGISADVDQNKIISLICLLTYKICT